MNAEQSEGATVREINAIDGVRQSAADAYLRPFTNRGNLTIVTEALVERIAFAHGRGERVHYRERGETRSAIATREIVLCAGAIGSPHLLMLSGIGPADHLRSHGIDVLVDAPEVGANLADHLALPLTWQSIRPIEPGVNQHGDVWAALRATPGSAFPDVHLSCVDLPLAPLGLQAEAPAPGRGFSINLGALDMHNRGTVRLGSDRPEDAPLIDPAFLNDERDMTTILAGIRIAREVIASSALDFWRGHEVFPGPAAEENSGLRVYVRSAAVSYNHASCTCRMGDDADSVVDLDLRVRGVEGLRVVDASVMPSIPAANPNATVLAIAERAAAIITGEEAVSG